MHFRIDCSTCSFSVMLTITWDYLSFEFCGFVFRRRQACETNANVVEMGGAMSSPHKFMKLPEPVAYTCQYPSHK